MAVIPFFNTVLRTRYLEVHVAQVVFVTEDVGEDGIFVFTCVLDKTHGDTRYGVLDLHTGIHQGQRAGAYGSHGGRTVGFEDIGNDTYHVRIVCGNLSLQCAPCQVAVTDFTTAYTALCLSFARRERGEVVVQQEALLAVSRTMTAFHRG